MIEGLNIADRPVGVEAEDIAIGMGGLGFDSRASPTVSPTDRHRFNVSSKAAV